MAADFPLGVTDLYYSLPPEPVDGDHWYWCRRHEEPEHVSQSTKREPDKSISCVRIGPFMSWREASTLRRDHLSFVEVKDGHVKYERPPAPLGMEIER